jgi:type I restriction enzyme S subunit
MDHNILLQNLEIITEAPSGLTSFKSLVFNLAVGGRLVKRIESDSNALNAIPELLRKKFSHPNTANWLLLPLAECAEIFNGNSTSSTEKNRLSKVTDGRPLIATKDVGYGFQPISLDTGLRVPASNKQYKIAPADSVLICLEGGSAGKKMGLLSQDVCFGNKLFANVCKPWIDSKFLLICLLSSNFSGQFQMQLSGIIGGISKAKYGQIKIPVPPLPEQKRIVAKVDELMMICDRFEQQKIYRDDSRISARKSAIDAISTAITSEEAETAWNRIAGNWAAITDTPKSIASMRSLILDLAVHGKLMSPSEKVKLDASQYAELGSLMTLEYGKPLDRSLRNGQGEIPVYGANGVKAMTGQPLVRDRGIVVGRKGSAGEVNMTDGPFWPLDVTFFAKFDKKTFDLQYLFYLLKSLNLPKMARGIKPGINRNDVNKIKVLHVNLVEQKRIVAKVDELMMICDQLESVLNSRSEIAEKFARSVVSSA